MTKVVGCEEYPDRPVLHYVKYVTMNNSQYADAEGTLREPIYMNEVCTVVLILRMVN